MKLKEFYKRGSSDTKKLKKIFIPKKYSVKTGLFSLLLVVILLIPFILIYVNIFQLISGIRMAFIVHLVIAFQILSFILTIGSLFEVMLAREYLKNDENSILVFEKALEDVNKETKNEEKKIVEGAPEMIERINSLDLKACLFYSVFNLKNLIVIIGMFIILFVLCQIIFR